MRPSRQGQGRSGPSVPDRTAAIARDPPGRTSIFGGMGGWLPTVAGPINFSPFLPLLAAAAASRRPPTPRTGTREMAKKGKDAAEPDAKAAAVRSLFSADNPFRRKESAPEEPPRAPPPTPASAAVPTPARKPPKRPQAEAEAEPAVPSRRKRSEEDGEGPAARRKRKRDEVEAGYERRTLGAAPADEEQRPRPVVGAKRKAPHDVEAAASGGESEDEAFDDEGKLLRTVFVGNLPLRTKRKALTKEFAAFGEVDSVRIRSVPLGDTKIPRKGAVIKGKINDLVDNVHAYIVFKDEQCARTALSHNMALFNGNHIRVDMACPPRKKLRGEGPLYDRKRTVFVGNLPFDVKDEELYQLFCGPSGPQGDVEAIRVVRDPDSSLGKGIAYVLFKTREAANAVVKKRGIKIRDRFLRLTHAKAADATPKKADSGKKRDTPKQKTPFTSGSKSREGSDSNKRKAPASLSYQGLKSTKSGVVKKVKVARRPVNQGKQQGRPSETGQSESARKAKRPAVAARKAKQLNKKRKQDGSTPENTHRSKKARK
uniref:RRM domain-containing protein n=5 Tax=Triticinae TaxID=1648030 RepID=A0A453MLA3_AEGTS